MGNQNKKNEFDSSNWEVLTQIGTKTVLKNITTHSLLDSYQYEHPSEAYTNQHLQNIYQWRQQITIQQHIPLLYHYEIEQPLLGLTHTQKVFTEHLTRFSELQTISKPEAFFILQQIIQVLPMLFKQFGLFHVNIYTIGINDSGQTKIWMNQNLAKNYAEPQDVIKKPSQNLQLTIVNNIVRMVKTKVFNNEIKPQYPFSINFLDTLKYIKDIRQIYPDYNINKVYIDRNEFNQQQQIKVPISQQSEILSTNQISPRKIAKQSQVVQQVKNIVYWQPPYFKNMNQTPIRHQSTSVNQQPSPSLSNQIFINKSDSNANQIMNPVLIGNKPIYRQNNNFFSINPNISIPPKQNNVLQKSYYLTSANNSPMKYANKKITPPKPQKPRFSPSKFFKTERVQVNKVINYENPIKINRVGPNRSTSMSPSKMQKEIKAVSPIIVPYKQNVSVRPISSNMANKKHLSRIIEQQQGKFDSHYARHVEKRVDGGSFNVELVESIYIQSNQTDQGF